MKGRPFAFTMARGARFAWGRHSGVALIATAMALAPGLVVAESITVTATAPTQPINGNAQFNIVVNISKFLFFGIGISVSDYPTPNSTISTLNFLPFAASVAVPNNAGGTTTGLVGNNNTGVSWNGQAPIFAFPTRSLPVRVHSNAGQVSIVASVVTPLTSSGFAGNFGFARLTGTSDNVNLPVPPSPNPGTSAGQIGTPIPAGPPMNGITNYSANWTFGFDVTDGYPGTYSGRLSYTATSL